MPRQPAAFRARSRRRTARKLTDKNDESLDEVRRKAGFGGELEDVKLPSGYYKAFVELHIEQGPLLERERVPLGIVTKIAAPASARVSIEGAGGHAGGVLMPDRRDALCAASELILAIENAARTSGSVDTVATVGMCDVFPGAVNSIPSRVRISVDVRDTDLARRDECDARDGNRVAANSGAEDVSIADRAAERGCAGRLRAAGGRCAFRVMPASTARNFN